MIIKFLISVIFIYFYPNNNSNLPDYKIFIQTLPVGICTVIDIALSSMGIEHVTASTFTILRSGGIIWVLGISVYNLYNRYVWDYKNFIGVCY